MWQRYRVFKPDGMGTLILTMLECALVEYSQKFETFFLSFAIARRVKLFEEGCSVFYLVWTVFGYINLKLIVLIVLACFYTFLSLFQV